MEKYKWLNKHSRLFLERDYLDHGVSAEDRIWQIVSTIESEYDIPGYAKETEEFFSQGCYSLSTPFWINLCNDKGLPISCNGSYIGDTMESILDKVSEVGIMSKKGAGTSAYFGDLRPRGASISVGGSSSGPVHFMELFDKVADVVSQGSARRGSFAAYLPVEHPDIEEFLRIRSDGHPIQNMSIGVTITDSWMNEMLDGDKGKRKIWGKIIQKRFETGYPYIFFTDTVNNGAPDVYKELGYKIHASNLCTEICLPSSENMSFVCDLMSINAERYDYWKDKPKVIHNAIILLDYAMTSYIKKIDGNKHMASAKKFAEEHRALGLGLLGWHSLLQSKMIPFESMDAKYLNIEIWKRLQKESLEVSKWLAEKFGEPTLLKGKGRRNTTLLAVAPTTSSSFILGQVSPSIEPENSCYYVKKLAKGSFTYKNPYLKKLLKDKEMDTDDIWKSILVHGGSVQHLDFLSKEEKDVFKTFGEISQKEVIVQAAQRQKYIDQSQSLNIMVPPDTKPKEVSDLLIEAWRLKVKTLYYQRSANPVQQLSRSISNCVSCEA